MYYAIFDTQTGCYLATGYNAESKKEVADAYVSYASTEFDTGEEVREMIDGMGIEDVLNSSELILEEQEEPFKDLEEWK